MKNKICFASALFSLFFLLSFRAPEIKGIDAVFSAGCSNTKIELSLSEDFSFTYIDQSSSSQLIDLSGKYEIDENTIILKASDSTVDFRDKWKLIDNNTGIRSRKGFSIYYLRSNSAKCNESCKSKTSC